MYKTAPSSTSNQTEKENKHVFSQKPAHIEGKMGILSQNIRPLRVSVLNWFILSNQKHIKIIFYPFIY